MKKDDTIQFKRRLWMALGLLTCMMFIAYPDPRAIMGVAFYPQGLSEVARQTGISKTDMYANEAWPYFLIIGLLVTTVAIRTKRAFIASMVVLGVVLSVNTAGCRMMNEKFRNSNHSHGP